jgi:sorting nexin-29
MALFIICKVALQGDTLACLLFNITLEYAIRKSGVQTRGTMFYKSVQIVAYAEDIVVIGRSSTSMKEAFQLLEEESKEERLVGNEGKTKCMVAVNTQNYSKSHAIEIGRYSFEKVDRFS